MYLSEHFPQSMEGMNFNGIQLEKALVERILTEYRFPKFMNQSMNVEMIDWLFQVGIYESKEQYYLFLESNDHNSFVNYLIDNGFSLNTGIVQISKEDAIDLMAKISELGKEYFAIPIANFQEIMNLMISAMDCPVRLTPLLQVHGYYDKMRKEIVIANNMSQFDMIWTLMHEYVHFLLNSDKLPPQTIEEYDSDKEEYLCNTVAMDFIVSGLGDDFVQTIVENATRKISPVDCKEANEIKHYFDEFGEKMVFSPEERCLMAYVLNTAEYFETEKDLIDFAHLLFERIWTSFHSQEEKNIETKIDCSQSGFVLLSSDDNKKLYDIIINEMLPRMPSEDDVEE